MTPTSYQHNATATPTPTTKRPPIASRNDEKHAQDDTDEIGKNAIKGNENAANSSGARFTKYLRVSDLVEH